jgi:hypothetical protein
MISMIAWCSILSKAFSKSSLMITTSFLVDLHRWMYSNAQARQSCMVLVFMKPYWLAWTKCRCGM